ncbi:hypothetical protein A5789_03045 [Nocardia sp. 852002-51101_SCH5132738]|nr:hypothetical protein A5789_02940 [Nocardia sp. 852002-51101_SCH5132738]OBA48041.1 hypothetical protein A5789_03045 [Nocardia sp. 852002-51101_SCH5132738]
MVASRGRVCPGSEMTAALGPYGVLVDVHDDGVFDDWEAKQGLRCLLCGNKVEPYHSRVGNPFLRHGKRTPAGQIPIGGKGSETFDHALLKYWTRDRLEHYGLSDATVEPHIGDQFPDVYGTKNGIAYAVEVQWSHLDLDTARARTEGLRAAGCDRVVWLTRHCNWVEKLPAAGVSDFRPAIRGGYELHTGVLRHQPARRGPGTRMVVARWPLDRFLLDWTSSSTDELAWAYSTATTAGWATVTDWEQHTKDQAHEIATKKRQLADALAERDQLRTDLRAARATANSHAEKIDEQAQTITDQVRTLGDRDSTIADQKKAIGRAAAENDRLTSAAKKLLAMNSQAEEGRKKSAAEIEQLKRTAARLTNTCIVFAVLCLVLAIGWVIWLA